MKTGLFLFWSFWFLALPSWEIRAQHYRTPIHYSKWIQNFQPSDSLRGITTFSNIPIAFFMEEANGQVEQYEKLEIGISLPEDAKMQIANFVRSGRGLNPFDPEQISIRVFFNHIDQTKSENHKTKLTDYTLIESLGFYYEEFHPELNDDRFKHGYWKKDTTSFNFRVRFAPRKLGWWSCTINILVNNELTYTLPTFSFLCIPGRPSNGFINGISENKRMLQFENGTNFFGIGQNIPFADLQNAVLPAGMGKTRAQPPQGFILQRSYIEDLAKNGGNLVRIMHSEWVDAIEWEKLNDYSMNMNFAWEFDQTVNLCHEKKVYILWLQQAHTAFMAKNPYGDDRIAWSGNPYHIYLDLEKPEDFFTSEEALKKYKNKIRYVLSRWGYSRMIAGIQPMSEMNEMAANITDAPVHHPYMTDTAFRNDVAQWFFKIKNYIQQDLGYDFLIGSSFTGDVGATVTDDPVMRIADFNDYHPYGQSRNENLAARFGGINVTPGYGIFKRYQKPVIIGEMGTWDTEYLHECHENEFHNNIWATAFMGGWAGGLHWHDWEDNWNRNLRANFKGLNTFLEYNFDSTILYEPARWPENNLNDSTYSEREANYFEALYMIGNKKVLKHAYALGWIHNRSAYWYNYPETDCEKNLVNTKSKSANGKKKFRPADDDTGETIKTEGDKNKNKRIVKISGLQRLKKYYIYFYDTKDGKTLTQYAKFHSFGKLELEIPEEINQMEYQDLAFKVIRKKDNIFRVKF